ncbi:undecaprenyl-phosphate alpha-N-acetylglucosaminyl 1-phosphate transferase [Hahella sp. CCB-MM4]|uniref:UDP-N-acetylglucosamine--undecaprenyl-phosphate N-acetylglucosaminephosphotransferase n=1 Tax=Hahella sp. (strain CCB-MM4) TaxID=1926491 RepID=UPI000B9B8DB4|nr:UDP-N-acetylglucosamine--undecaprenyl-phosphate N-acetylglucosaminephosphotransferase [Hahella sp. CCB-MM4]OZG73679.1 undecaprenyl-phosphate alpha-N-acetylglucosaminyl 1-phosphate transferase [Hahella sp. CCB-MM4]
MDIFVAILIAFILSFIAVSAVNPIAVKVGLVDVPNARKRHSGNVPLVGGIAIFFAVIFEIVFYVDSGWQVDLYLLASTLVVTIGALDDRYDLKVSYRLLAQTLAALIMIIGAGLYIDDLGDLLGFGIVELGYGGVLFTIVAVMGGINAFNMVDGIDGLVGCLSLVSFSSLAFLLALVDSYWLFLPVFFMGAILAYLMFNLGWPSKKAKKIFMGDAGSMLIGFTVVWLLVVGTQEEEVAFHSVTALWIIAVPLMDMAAIMCRRMLKGESPFKPDRNHLHHIFIRAGFTSRQALLVITLTASLLAMFGVAMQLLEVKEWVSLSLFLSVFALYCWQLQYIWRAVSRIRRLLSRTGVQGAR